MQNFNWNVGRTPLAPLFVVCLLTQSVRLGLPVLSLLTQMERNLSP